MRNKHLKQPNAGDVAAIESFLGSISWASECTTCQQVGRDRVWLKVSNLYVLVPTDSENYPENSDEIFIAAKTLDLKPGAIFYGNPTDYHRSEVNHISGKSGIVVYWVGAKNCIAYSRWLREASDGFDLFQGMIQAPE